MYIYMDICRYIYIYVCRYIYICIYVYIYICIPIYVGNISVLHMSRPRHALLQATEAFGHSAARLQHGLFHAPPGSVMSETTWE